MVVIVVLLLPLLITNLKFWELYFGMCSVPITSLNTRIFVYIKTDEIFATIPKFFLTHNAFYFSLLFFLSSTLSPTLLSFQVLQREIEERGKEINSLVRRCESAADGATTASYPTRLRRYALHLERSWHHIWIRSLEIQCLTEQHLLRHAAVIVSWRLMQILFVCVAESFFFPFNYFVNYQVL